MKRKLISFDVFKKIEADSVSSAQTELIAAEDVLATTLGLEGVELHCFGESDVTYQTLDGSYIHANYKLNKDQLVVENIEELVVDETTEKKAAREVLSSMVEALLDNNEAKASDKFENYLNLPVIRRDLVSEGFNVTVSKPTGPASPLRHKKQSRSLVAKRIRAMKKTKKTLSSSPSLRSGLARKRHVAAQKLGGSKNPRFRTYARKIKPSTMKEWNVMCENVMDYLDYKEFGPTAKLSQIQKDEKGNVTGIAMPTVQKRNEAKILTFNWKTLDHEVKVQRSKMKKNLSEDNNFVKAMADLKRYNGISDNNALEETLEKVVSFWPDVIYLTHAELSEHIANALEVANVKNYDDDMCNFMAEGILWKAHSAFTDRVKKITNLAGVEANTTTEGEDAFKNFKQVCDTFYPQLDESDKAELKIFADLFKALHEVYKVAGESNDALLRDEVGKFLTQCESVLNREVEPDLLLAENISNFLFDLTEANVEGAQDTWDVSNTAHDTVNGDHPRMNWAAKQNDAVPSKYPGDWGGTAPVSDGKTSKNGLEDEMRNRSWSNYADGDTYPDIKNPSVPSPFGDYKMKGEEGAETGGTSDWSRWQSDETWPNLKNPYIPTEKVGMGGKGYKMKNDNLVVDQ